ncbi:MAG: hypothetical protein ACJ8C4_04990 [Gemmataceae bacterium]
MTLVVNAQSFNSVPGHLTLREAIILANQNVGTDTINFDSTAFNGTPILIGGVMNIVDDVVINGPGKSLLVLSGHDSVQIFNIQSGGKVNISGMTLTHGKVFSYGGAIAFTNQTVTLNNMTFSNNSALSIGGAINFTSGSLNVTNSTFSSNTAADGGAIGYSTGKVSISTCTLISNTAAVGGAIYTNDSNTAPTSSIVVLNSILSGNTGSSYAGAIYVGTATVDIETSIVKNNVAADSGIIRPQGTSTNLLLPQITINNSLISGNTTTGTSHGLVYSFWGMKLTISNSTVAGNTCSGYGFLEPYEGAQINLINSTFTNNKTQYGVVGPYHTAGGTPSITIENCTIVGNTGTTSYAGGLSQSTSTTLKIDSSIIAGNVGGLSAAPDIYTPSSTTIIGDHNVIGLHYSAYMFSGSPNYEGASTATLEKPGVNLLADNGGIVLPDGSRLPTMRPRSAADPGGNVHVLSGSGFGGSNSLNLPFDERGPGFARGVACDIGAIERAFPLPTVTSVVFGDGSPQRSLVKRIVVTFSQPVSFMGGTASAFTVHRTGSGGTIGDVTLAASPSSGPASTVTITFAGNLTDPGGSLKDGLYNFLIDAAQVSGAGSIALDGNNDGIPGGSYVVTGTAANKFYRLFGDQNGDAATDQMDYLIFRNAVGGPSTVFDFDNDRDVGQTDYLEFRKRLAVAP